MTANHKIGLFSATIICMNAMIGAGIFTTPAKLATTVGPAGILTYLFVIIAVFFMAYSIARVAQAYPQEGSFYTYAKQWGGHLMGTLAAGAYIVGVVIALGLMAKIAAGYFHNFLPSLSTNLWSIIIISAITALNMAGVRIMKTGQIILLSCTLFALGITTLLCFFNANTANLIPFMPHGFSSIASSMSVAIFAFFGFESAASLYNMVESPEKNVPRALLISLFAVGIIYMAFIFSIILAVPASTFTSGAMPLSQALMAVFPDTSFIATIIGIAVLTAICGVLQSMMYSVSALTQSFLRLQNWEFCSVNSNNCFSYIILTVGAVSLALSLYVQSLGLLFNLVAMFIVFAFAASIFTLVAKKIDKTIGQKLITYLGLSTACIVFFNALYGLISELK